MIPALERLKQEALEFEASLGSKVRLCLRTTNQKTNKQTESIAAIHFYFPGAVLS